MSINKVLLKHGSLLSSFIVGSVFAREWQRCVHGCQGDRVAHNAKNTYFLAFSRRRLATLALRGSLEEGPEMNEGARRALVGGKMQQMSQSMQRL